MKTLLLFLGMCLSLPLAQAEKARVQRVIDGDTFVLDNGERVRMLGIDTPEMGDFEFYAVEAKNYLKRRIEGKRVELIADSHSDNRDRYDRLLRYVMVSGVDVIKELVAKGYARVYTKYKVDRRTEYLEVEAVAIDKQLGIWQDAGLILSLIHI